MAASVTFTFVPGTDIEAGQANQNFQDLINFLNGLSIPGVPVTIVQGGTGGVTAAQALANLGAAPAASVPALPITIPNGGTGAITAAAALAALNGVDLTQFTAGLVLGQPFNAPILTNGLLIKGGTTTMPNSGAATSTKAIAFDTPFSVCYGVIVSAGGLANSGTGHTPAAGYTGLVPSGFTLVLEAFDTIIFNQTCPASWVAFGRA